MAFTSSIIHYFQVIFGILCLASGLERRQTTFENQCSSFQPEAAGISNATITNHAFVAAGTNLSLPGADSLCGVTSRVVEVDLCRVSLDIATSSRSSVLAEIWMPADWNGRLVTIGNGGLSGCIDYGSVSYTTRNGFATVGTNAGHNGTTGIQFLNNLDVVIDFSYRAIHVGVEAGKALVSSLYGNGANSSYFVGCSTGGRQAVKAADMFPDDFDGIVAGAPGVDFNSLYSWRASFLPITGAVGSANFISPNTWKTTIHDEILRQCDTIDGVADGIIEDPILCKFDPSTLLCDSGSTNTSTCLTSAQVGIVRTVLSPYRWENGTLIYPGMNPGSELITADGLYSGTPWAFSQNWFRYAVYNDPDWDAATYTLADAQVCADVNAGNIRTWPNTLSNFQSKGGKMVIYHGSQDNQISSFNTPRFYEYLQSGMGYSTSQMDDFLRAFRISGLFHCNGGPGAWVIGQGGGTPGLGLFDRQHNVLAAVVDWFEQGIAPETITGTKFLNDTVSLGVSYTRSHCRWPFRNVYLGGGLDPDEATSWECQQISAEEAAIGTTGQDLTV